MEAVMAKKLAAWQIQGLDGPPPVVKGYHDYGVQWTPEHESQRESLRHVWDTATWSWSYWGKKVIRDIAFEREAGRRGTLAQRLGDRVAIVLVRMTAALYRPKG
jgi:hypothetical protein